MHNVKNSAKRVKAQRSRKPHLQLVLNDPKPNGTKRKGEVAAPCKPQPGFKRLLENCRARAKVLKKAKKESSTRLQELLDHMFRLRLLVKSSPAAEKKLAKACEVEGIKVTKSTTNDCIPLVKLILPKLKRPTLSRYACVLRLAEQDSIKPDDFVGFIQQKGGVTRCADLAAEKRGDGTEQTSPAERVKQKLKERRKSAPMLSIKPQVERSSKGLHVLLVERARGGKYRCFSCRPASDREALSILKD